MKEKILYFEGAGCVPVNDVKNCRIRTAFTNLDGKKIYIEILSGCQIEKKGSKYMQHYEMIYCDYCHYITDDPEIDDCNKSKLKCERNIECARGLKYTKENLLKFVNDNCNADFTKIVILNELTGFKVHNGTQKGTCDDYNFGDEFIFNEELTSKALLKRDELKKLNCERFNMKYDNSSYWLEDNKLVMRLNVSNSMTEIAGIKERIQYFDLL